MRIEPKKILVFLMAGIGDALIATPMLAELQVSFPNARRDVLVRWKASAQLLKDNPNVDSIHHHDLAAGSLMERVGVIRKLRAEKYDLIVLSHPHARREYRILASAIGFGHATIASHEYDNWNWIDDQLVTVKAPQNYYIHSTGNNCNLLKAIGCDISVPYRKLELFFRKKIGMHVGSGNTKNLAGKRWPLENWIELIQRLNAERPDLEVWLFGADNEKELHERIVAAGCRVTIHSGNSIVHTAEAMGQCTAFISVDTSLMHVASAMLRKDVFPPYHLKHQFIIESPTLNATNKPETRFTLIANPKCPHGRNLDYYRYDGGNIRASDTELLEFMSAVTVRQVFEQISRVL